jgi:hypothetical protein
MTGKSTSTAAAIRDRVPPPPIADSSIPVDGKSETVATVPIVALTAVTAPVVDEATAAEAVSTNVDALVPALADPAEMVAAGFPMAAIETTRL